LPNRNLVSNVGFGEDATHTTGVADPTVADRGLGDLIHPSFVLRDGAADRFGFDHHFCGAAMQNRQTMRTNLKVLLRGILHSRK
jgi:hypothetical protein